MNLKERAQKLKTDIPIVFTALRKKETPFLAKLVAGITICYALSPIDLIPDFVPVLGYLDDVIILPALIVLTVKLIPKDVLDRCRKEAENLWPNGRPKKWYYGIPIVLIWLFLLWLIVKALW
ncbi:MAG: YkvA family protein [Clostridia bacterium]